MVRACLNLNGVINPHFHLYPVWKLEGTDKGTDVWSGVHAPVLAGPAQQGAPRIALRVQRRRLGPYMLPAILLLC